jgi:predicted phosphodiesterase
VTFADRLRAPGPQPDPARRARPAAARATDAGVQYQADGSMLVTLPDLDHTLDGPEAQREAIESLGVSIPDGWRVRVSQMRYDPAAWHRDAQGEDAVTRPVWRYVFVVEPEPDALLADDLDDLLAYILQAEPAYDVTGDQDGCAVVAYADLQLGKVDERGGTEVIIQQVLDKTAQAVEHLLALRARGVAPDTVALLFLGDCIEGMVSQGGRLAWRTDSTITQMVRILRRLVLRIIDSFLPHFAHVIVAVVPGNHDQAIRQPVTTTADDSWDVDAISAVADGMSLNPERYGRVAFVFPQNDDLTVTLDLAGTIVTLAHGHQFRRGNALAWWAGQATGMTAAGDSTLLLSGHLHHLRVETAGPRTFIQAPALDPGSSWFRQQTGMHSPAGLLTFTTRAGRWDHLRIL